MKTSNLHEQLLEAWITLNSLLKDSKMTRDMTYNEAIVMRLAFQQYLADGEGRVAVRQILRQTNMLKSLVNRTVDALCVRGFLVKEKSENDRRSLYVRPVPEKLPEFLAVHQRSLQIADQVIQIIGESDAAIFVQCCRKLWAAGIEL